MCLLLTFNVKTLVCACVHKLKLEDKDITNIKVKRYDDGLQDILWVERSPFYVLKIRNRAL